VPDAVAGHSVGEVAAAVAAGVLTLDEGMRLVLKRGRQMASAGAGRMLAAEMTLEAAGALLTEVGGVEIAAENGPRSVVFAGAPDAMERVHAALEERAVFGKAGAEPMAGCGVCVSQARRWMGRVRLWRRNWPLSFRAGESCGEVGCSWFRQ